MLGVVIFLGTLWTATALLTREYRIHKLYRAERAADSGRSALATGESASALAKFRQAVALDPSRPAYRLDLSRALAALGYLPEATSHLSDILRRDPVNGPANLAMARVHRAAGRLAEGETYYYRAIYGLWSADEQQTRVDTRLELIELLQQTANRDRVRAEFTQLATAFPGDLALQIRIGRSLLMLGFLDEAARVFRVAAGRFAEPGASLAGLAGAEFARGDYVAALDAAERALTLDASDAESIRWRDTAAEVLAMDPTRPRLSTRERARRLHVVIEQANEWLTSCVDATAESENSTDLQSQAEQFLKGVNRQQGDHYDVGLGLAEELARAVLTHCPNRANQADAVALLLRKLAAPA